MAYVEENKTTGLWELLLQSKQDKDAFSAIVQGLMFQPLETTNGVVIFGNQHAANLANDAVESKKLNRHRTRL